MRCSSEERLRLALEAAQAGTWDWNVLDGDFNDLESLKRSRIDFRSPQGAFNASYGDCLQLIFPEDRQRVNDTIIHSLKDATHFNLEYRMFNDQGELRWMAARGQTLTVETTGSGADRQVRSLGVFVDITERRCTEEQLQRSAQRLHNLLEVDRAILQQHTPAEVSGVALGRLHSLLKCHRVSIAQFDLEAGEGVILAACSKQETQWGAGAHFPLAHICGNIEELKKGQICCLEDSFKLANPSPLMQSLQAEGLRSFVGVPLVAGEQLIGCLYLSSDRPGPFADEDIEIAYEMAGHLAVAIRHADLFNQVRIDQENLQALPQKLIEAQEAERRTIAQELHDEINSALTAAKVSMQTAQQSTKSNPEAITFHLQAGVEVIGRALEQVRELSLNLRPSMLDDFGLVDALAWYIDRQAQIAGLSTGFRHNLPDERLPASIETACFRIAQEALTNVIRHARARHVEVTLCQIICHEHTTALELTVRDDGIGFDMSASQEAQREPSQGLLGMKERATLMGGDIAVESGTGQGTEVHLHLPLLIAEVALQGTEVPETSKYMKPTCGNLQGSPQTV